MIYTCIRANTAVQGQIKDNFETTQLMSVLLINYKSIILVTYLFIIKLYKYLFNTWRSDIYLR